MQLARHGDVSYGQLWFGLLGGAVAWTIHLLAAYVLGEFGCLSYLGEVFFLGINAVAWSVLGVSVLLALVAGAATWIAYRYDRQFQAQARERGEPHADTEMPEASMARIGWISSGSFLFTILFETVPVFYFLQNC